MAKKPQYRLETLMVLRERAKDEAERALGDRIAELKIEQKKLEELELELERMIQHRETKKREYAEKQMRGEMSPQAVISSKVYMDRLKEQEQLQEEAIEAQHGVIAQRKQAVNEARQHLVTATQELKALEKHKENWEKEVRLARQRKEEDQQDEIAQTIFLRRQ